MLTAKQYKRLPDLRVSGSGRVGGRGKMSPRQQAILQFIGEVFVREARLPTIRDICDQFGISSPNGAVCHLDCLMRQGFIKYRREGRTGFYEVVGLAEAIAGEAVTFFNQLLGRDQT